MRKKSLQAFVPPDRIFACTEDLGAHKQEPSEPARRRGNVIKRGLSVRVYVKVVEIKEATRSTRVGRGNKQLEYPAQAEIMNRSGIYESDSYTEWDTAFVRSADRVFSNTNARFYAESKTEVSWERSALAPG